MSVIESQESWKSLGGLSVGNGPIGELPSAARRQAKLEERLNLAGSRIGPNGMLAGLTDLLGEGLVADRFEVQWRAAGLNRPGVIAQLTWPRLSTRVGLSIEPALAHALVDRLLGFQRMPAEGRLQVTPVEWGILSFVTARALDRLEAKPGPLGPWDLAIDRVGPDPFDPSGLGPIVTWKWQVRIGQTSASARLWLPESLMALWLRDDPPATFNPVSIERFADLLSTWIASAGTLTISEGVTKLRKGAFFPIDGSPLEGTPASPEGTILLFQDDATSRSSFQTHAIPESNGARLILDSLMQRELRSRGNHSITVPVHPTPPTGSNGNGNGNGKSKLSKPSEAPITLIVELGRLNLPLHRLADLQPGDVIEFDRNPRDPVELTSGDRLIARGELVQVESQLGVRVTQVFL